MRLSLLIKSETGGLFSIYETGKECNFRRLLPSFSPWLKDNVKAKERNCTVFENHFKKSDFMWHFQNYQCPNNIRVNPNLTLFVGSAKVAKWDFLCDFQTLCYCVSFSLITIDTMHTNKKVWNFRYATISSFVLFSSRLFFLASRQTRFWSWRLDDPS